MCSSNLLTRHSKYTARSTWYFELIGHPLSLYLYYSIIIVFCEDGSKNKTPSRLKYFISLVIVIKLLLL